MPTHSNPAGPNDGHGEYKAKLYHDDGRAKHSVDEGFEVTDVSVRGVGAFLVALSVTLVIFFVFAFGMGKVINTVLLRSDGPPSPWQQAGNSKTGAGGVHLAGKNMQSSPAIEQKQLHQLIQAFPTPRLQTDDGDQDLADLHQREDLLLTHYSWADQQQGKIRIPISRAMELIAERGLPVAPQENPPGQAGVGAQAGAGAPAQAQLMFGDSKPVVQVPLTSGFARTGYEQERESGAGMAGDQSSAKANDY